MYWKVCQKSKVLLIRVGGLKGKKRSFGKDVAVGSKMDLVLWALAQQKLWFRTPSNTCRKHLAARKAWGETLVFQRVPERWSSWVRPLRIAWWQIPQSPPKPLHISPCIFSFIYLPLVQEADSYTFSSARITATHSLLAKGSGSAVTAFGTGRWGGLRLPESGEVRWCGWRMIWCGYLSLFQHICIQNNEYSAGYTAHFPT